jgi:rubrerythrin
MVSVQENGKELLMTKWLCSNCGYQIKADAPPVKCPSCNQQCEFVDNTCYTPDCWADVIDTRIKPK